jgi:TonB family protein
MSNRMPRLRDPSPPAGRAAWLAALLCMVLPGAARADWPSCTAEGLTAARAVVRDVPAYPEAAREVGSEGYVDVSFVVLRDGGVGWVRVLGAEPPGLFEDAATNGVRTWHFEPARRQGEPVECRLSTRVKFRLVDDPSEQPAV